MGLGGKKKGRNLIYSISCLRFWGSNCNCSCNPPAMDILQWSSSRLRNSSLTTLLIVKPEAHSKCRGILRSFLAVKRPIERNKHSGRVVMCNYQILGLMVADPAGDRSTCYSSQEITTSFRYLNATYGNGPRMPRTSQKLSSQSKGDTLRIAPPFPFINSSHQSSETDLKKTIKKNVK